MPYSSPPLANVYPSFKTQLKCCLPQEAFPAYLCSLAQSGPPPLGSDRHAMLTCTTPVDMPPVFGSSTPLKAVGSQLGWAAGRASITPNGGSPSSSRFPASGLAGRAYDFFHSSSCSSSFVLVVLVVVVLPLQEKLGETHRTDSSS